MLRLTDSYKTCSSSVHVPGGQYATSFQTEERKKDFTEVKEMKTTRIYLMHNMLKIKIFLVFWQLKIHKIALETEQSLKI